jgi:hypothetical protein
VGVVVVVVVGLHYSCRSTRARVPTVGSIGILETRSRAPKTAHDRVGALESIFGTGAAEGPTDIPWSLSSITMWHLGTGAMPYIYSDRQLGPDA